MSNKNKSKNRSSDLSQYGLFNVPTNLNMGASFDDNLDEGDSDLEAELLALTNSGSKSKQPRHQPPAPPVANVNLDGMVSESLKDIPSDDDISVDENDPELLGELNELTAEEVEVVESQPELPSPNESSTDIVKLLEERVKMYEVAESNAKSAGESSRARRFNRGVKTLKDLLKQARAGKTIKDDDIPPVVSTGVKNTNQSNEGVTLPTRAAPPPPPSNDVNPPAEEATEATPDIPNNTTKDNSKLLEVLNTRKTEYKFAALAAKKAGDKDTAMNFLKITKQFEAVIKAVESGQLVDLSNMPGPPPLPAPVDTPPAENQTQNAAPPSSEENEEEIQPEPQLITAATVAEALEQRLAVYKKQEEAAKEQGNSSKARRMGRIIKQFEQAIKLNKAGKPIPIDELPTPPGYAPIPGTKTESEPKPTPPAETKPEPAIAPQETPQSPKKPTVVKQNTIRLSGNHVANSRSEKQIVLLLAKQKEFKIAALKAKQNGEIEQAKEYLRNAKRIEPLIDAACGGLPVDMSSLPISPNAKIQLDAEYDVVMAEECTEENTSDMDIIARLESQLTKQLKLCLTTRDHHKALGDVAGTNRFERLALSVTKDLDFVRVIHRTGGSVPKFHYEMKDFSIVKSFTELGDNDLELSILRGINYNCSNPNEIDTYVKCEFPFPQDFPWREKTTTVKNTNNPDYNATFIIPIQRTVRNCLRLFKRHGIKFEIYSKGGFFRSDTLLGTVSVKLQPLETQCELHDSFDVLDGRKKTGGKLEVRLRLRHPILTNQVEKIEEKWLIIDH